MLAAVATDGNVPPACSHKLTHQGGAAFGGDRFHPMERQRLLQASSNSSRKALR